MVRGLYCLPDCRGSLVFEVVSRALLRVQAPRDGQGAEIVEEGKAIEMPGQPYLMSEKGEQFDLSLVVPAYNEEERLPSMLE